MNIPKATLLFPVLSFFFAILTIGAQAQTDYIIMNDGTKVLGEMKSHTVKKVRFKADGSKKTQRFKPADITEAYKTGNKKFRSVELPNKNGKYFVEVLQDGKIKLYEFFKGAAGYRYSAPNPYGGAGFATTGNNPAQYWYAQKDGGELVEVKSNQIWGSRKARKDNLSALIADNPQVLNRYNKEDKFTFDFIRSLIEEYNTKASAETK